MDRRKAGLVALHHCPSCELIFSWKTELESHLRDDHPTVHFDYPQERPDNADWPLSSEPRRYTKRPEYPMRRRP